MPDASRLIKGEMRFSLEWLYHFPGVGEMIVFLGEDCYWSSVFDGFVYFFDFVVCDRDATGCPILPFVPEFKEECGNLVRVAVNHDYIIWEKQYLSNEYLHFQSDY